MSERDDVTEQAFHDPMGARALITKNAALAADRVREEAASKEWHRGSWMQTFTGKQFYPMDPAAADVDPKDIAHALSLLCRYNGHVDRFYSVAEHCVLLSFAVSPENALWALLHDATEAYVGDMIRPLKAHMPDYVTAEDRVMVAVAERFGLDSPHMPDEVRSADSRILLDERAELMKGKTPAAWAVDDQQPLNVPVIGWLPARAESEYLYRLETLTAVRS